MRHIIAILLQNEAGALTRVAGLFSTRGYNIESLSVAATDDPTVSRITLVTRGSDAAVQQIISQLNKLIDVVAVEDMTRGGHFERELVLLKLKVRPEQADAVRGYVKAAAAALGYAPDDIVGVHVRDLVGIHAEDWNFVYGQATLVDHAQNADHAQADPLADEGCEDFRPGHFRIAHVGAVPGTDLHGLGSKVRWQVRGIRQAREHHGMPGGHHRFEVRACDRPGGAFAEPPGHLAPDDRGPG